MLNVDASSDDSEDGSYNYDSAFEVVFDNFDESEVYAGESLFHVDHCGAVILIFRSLLRPIFICLLSVCFNFLVKIIVVIKYKQTVF